MAFIKTGWRCSSAELCRELRNRSTCKPKNNWSRWGMNVSNLFKVVLSGTAWSRGARELLTKIERAQKGPGLGICGSVTRHRIGPAVVAIRKSQEKLLGKMNRPMRRESRKPRGGGVKRNLRHVARVNQSIEVPTQVSKHVLMGLGD
jgi:hypothetical protein